MQRAHSTADPSSFRRQARNICYVLRLRNRARSSPFTSRPPKSLTTRCFCSRTLTLAKHAYFINKRKALACIWATEHWHWYLYGRYFTVRTEHSSFTTFLRAEFQKRILMHLLRLTERLGQYRYSVIYRLSHQNKVANMMWRNAQANRYVRTMPVDLSTRDSNHDVANTELQIRTVFGSIALTAINREKMSAATERNLILHSVKDFCGKLWQPRANMAKTLQHYCNVCDELFCANYFL